MPEKYELALPANTTFLDQTDVDAIAAMAKTRQLTNDEAQAALNDLAESLGAQHTKFRTELEAHPEVGGANVEAAQQHALRALDKFLPATTPDGAAIRTAMNKSGYGNYAPFVVLLSRIGKAMGEDRPAPPGAPPAGARKSHADVLFGEAATK